MADNTLNRRPEGSDPPAENEPNSVRGAPPHHLNTPPSQDELTQFQQFQRFQQFLRENPQPGQQKTSPELPATTSTTPAAKIEVPRWVRRIGAKIISLVLLVIALIIAGKLVYNYFFPTEGNSSEEAARRGGGSYHTNDIFEHNPYQAVRSVYDQIAQGSSGRVCFAFDEKARAQFAENMNAPSCEQAVITLHAQVSSVREYTDGIQWSVFGKTVDSNTPTAVVSSCDLDVKSGPSLGTFILTRVEMGQWLITGHARDPVPCPPPPEEEPIFPTSTPSEKPSSTRPSYSPQNSSTTPASETLKSTQESSMGTNS